MVPEPGDIPPGDVARSGKSHTCHLVGLTLMSVSTSPGQLRRRRPAHRAASVGKAAIIVAALTVVAASTSAVADLTPPATQPVPAASAEAAGPPVSRYPAVAEPAGSVSPLPAEDPCALSPEECPEANPKKPQRIATTQATEVTSCALGGASNPGGTLTTALGSSIGQGDNIVRYRVEVEDGLAIDPACFADAVAAILTDQRGWSSTTSFERVDDDSFDFRLILASPDTTNALCYPAATGGKYSCRNREKVVINLMRWETGAEDFGDDMNTYRRYLVNHEVGHFLGKAHLPCPGPGQLAPVMMQQTKSVGECLPNGWPTTDESE